MTLSDDILNVGLKLAMEFGPDFLKPINERLKHNFPELTDLELEMCNKFSYETANFGHDLVYRSWEGIHDPEIYRKLNADFKSQIKSKFEWMSEDNINRLFSQSCYFASK